MKAVFLVLGLNFAATSAAVDEPQRDPPMQCDVGPLRRTYGGTAWLVYSCVDQSTVVIAADAGNPANPFFFMFHVIDGTYQLYGEGTGDKQFTAAAFEDLKALTADEITALVEETRGQ